MDHFVTRRGDGIICYCRLKLETINFLIFILWKNSKFVEVSRNDNLTYLNENIAEKNLRKFFFKN